MKRHYRLMLNLFSFALLLFALYLNFIKKEGNDIFPPAANQSGSHGISSLQEDGKSIAGRPSDGTLVLR